MNESEKDIQTLVEDYFAARKGTREGLHKWILRRFIVYVNKSQKPLRLMTVKDVELFIRELRQAGYAPGSIANNFSFLRKFFDHLEFGGLVRNNVARTTVARAEKHEPKVYTDKQLLRVYRKYHPRQ